MEEQLEVLSQGIESSVVEWPDPEWTEYDLALVLAWIDYLEEKGIDIYLNRCNSEYASG